MIRCVLCHRELPIDLTAQKGGSLSTVVLGVKEPSVSGEGVVCRSLDHCLACGLTGVESTSIREGRSSPRGWIVAAVANDELRASVRVDVRQDSWHVQSFWTRSSTPGSLRRVLGVVQAMLVESPPRWIRAHVEFSNFASIRFVEKLGFFRSGYRAPFHRYRVHRRVLMKKLEELLGRPR